MNFIIYLFGSGLAFFLGVGLIVIAVGLTTLRRWPRLRRLSPVITIVGGFMVALSAAPLPYWIYAVLGVATVAWLIAERWRKSLTSVRLGLARLLVAALWLAAVAMELPYHLTPVIPAMGRPEMWVVGDSVTAGVGDPRTDLWPRILARNHNILIHDRWQIGGTVASALRKLEKEPLGDGIVLLEIGGNDMLGKSTVADFDERLEQLLALVCKPGRVVLMFEVPLPPFHNAYGAVQRRLSTRHGALLIPKRIFVEVLTADDATIDGVHLTALGHELMAETVWRLVAPAFGE